MDFVKIEEKGKRIFAKFPKTRRFLKGLYQRTMFLFQNHNFKYVGDLKSIFPEDGFEYFYGYYDKSPWDKNNRFVLCLRVKNAYKTPDSTEKASIIVIDTLNNNSVNIIGETHCWNSQQGCMAQWLGPDYEKRIIYNDFRNNKFVSIIYNFEKKKEEKVLDLPVYDVSSDGKFALTLDFTRLHRLRKGYGYANIKETTRKEKCPDSTAIWKIDLINGTTSEIAKYTDFYNFETRPEMKNAEHKVNHIMISPNGKRFMVLHRWFKKGEKYTRLVTMNIDGTDMYNLSDDNFVSHCCWKNDKEILSFLRKKETGNHYYLLRDKSNNYKLLWPELNTDGHCTYSPDKDYVVTDTYPNRKRIANVFICDEEKNTFNKIISVISPFKYDNDNRCDLHPRWSRNGNKICIDSVHDGKKGIYLIDNPFFKNKNTNKKDFIIPKIIHSVWMGNGKKSDIVKKCEKSWETFANDYTIIEWNEQNFDLSQVPQYVKDAYKEKKWAFVSDYIRLKVLYDHGGIYLDTDMEFFKRIDNCLKYDGFFCTESNHTVSTAIIAAKPHAKWIKELLNEYNDLNFYNLDGTFNTIPNTKRVQLYLEKKYNYKRSSDIQKFDDGLIVFPSDYFSPLNCYDGRLKITSNTYGMHHYDNTWKSKKEKIKKKVLQFLTRIFGEEIRYKISKKV